MSERLNEQTNIDTTELRDVSEGFSGVIAANTDSSSDNNPPPPASDKEEQ